MRAPPLYTPPAGRRAHFSTSVHYWLLSAFSAVATLVGPCAHTAQLSEKYALEKLRKVNETVLILEALPRAHLRSPVARVTQFTFLHSADSVPPGPAPG